MFFFRYLKYVFFVFLGTYLVIMVYYLLMQENIIFQPSKEYVSPHESYNVEELYIKTADGEDLQSWWVDNKNATDTVLFFHGNGGNLTDRIFRLGIFKSLNLNVLMIDYRGYGKSSGKIKKENDLYLDAEAAWDFLIKEKGIDPKNIIIWGRSVGGAAAIYLAQGKDIKALIIESSFYSLADIGKKHFPFLPIDEMLRFKFNNGEIIQNVHAPLLFVHSTKDDIIPFSQGEMLYSRALEPKKFLKLEKGDHNSDVILSYEDYFKGVKDFLSALAPENVLLSE